MEFSFLTVLPLTLTRMPVELHWQLTGLPANAHTLSMFVLVPLVHWLALAEGWGITQINFFVT